MIDLNGAVLREQQEAQLYSCRYSNAQGVVIAWWTVRATGHAEAIDANWEMLDRIQVSPGTMRVWLGSVCVFTMSIDDLQGDLADD